MKRILFVRKWKEYTSQFFLPKRSIRLVSILSRVNKYSLFSTYAFVLIVGQIYITVFSAKFCELSCFFAFYSRLLKTYCIQSSQTSSNIRSWSAKCDITAELLNEREGLMAVISETSVYFS
jgi:hypothetical protein